MRTAVSSRPGLARSSLRSRVALPLEILALRHQLAVLQRTQRKRPCLTWFDCALWIWLYRLWPRCLDAVVIVKPDTVVRLHRDSFLRYWRGKSRPGRPGLLEETVRTDRDFGSVTRFIATGREPDR